MARRAFILLLLLLGLGGAARADVSLPAGLTLRIDPARGLKVVRIESTVATHHACGDQIEDARLELAAELARAVTQPVCDARRCSVAGWDLGPSIELDFAPAPGGPVLVAVTYADMVTGGRPDLRRRAARFLARPAACAPASTLAAAPDWDGRVAEALRHAHDPRDSVDYPGRQELVALGPAALPAFARAYPKADLDERRVLVMAARSLDRPGACRSAPLLALALADTANEQVHRAAMGAGTLRCRALLDQLHALLGAESSPKVYAAIRGLEALGDPAAAPWLEQLLRQPDRPTGLGFLVDNPDPHLRFEVLTVHNVARAALQELGARRR